MVVYDKWLPLEVELLKKLAAEGLSRERIAQELGRNKNSVTGLCHRKNIKTGRLRALKATYPEPGGRR